MSLSHFPRTVKGVRQAQKRDGVRNSDHVGTCLPTGEKTQATGHIAGSQHHKCPFSQYVEILIISPKPSLFLYPHPIIRCRTWLNFAVSPLKVFLFCFKIVCIMCRGWYTCHSVEVQTTCGSLLSASTMRVSKIKISSLGLASALFAQLCNTHDFLYF